MYPHLKLTREDYPRLLATRVIRDDGDEYFGAFLTKTSVRILIDFLNRTFRLRSCDINIDGEFPVPCTQYFAKRCVAPCVAELCSRRRHQMIAGLIRRFLQNDREGLKKELLSLIDVASESLDFEEAANWRDVLQNIELFWSRPRQQVWLNDTVDTYDLSIYNESARVRLVTQRAGKMLGTWEHSLKHLAGVRASEAVGDVVKQFYRFHAPHEIRVPVDFAGRREFARGLTERFGRYIVVRVVGNNLPPTTIRAFEKAKNQAALKDLTSKKDAKLIQRKLQQEFDLEEIPTRVESFDVAHISATAFVGAMAVWEHGEMRREEYHHWLSGEKSELATIREILKKRFTEIPASLPSLVLIDGGRSHLNAAIDALKNVSARTFLVISAVKPRGKHQAVSHFLTEAGQRFEFDPKSAAHRLLQTLRDEAHDLSNTVHRQSRDMLHFYERRGVKPLIVPIRFDEKGGHADDLRPILTR